MDIITHTLSGLAVSTIVASESKKDLPGKAAILTAGALGAVFPDIDAVTMWSGFDSLIGKTLGLSMKGRDIYAGNLWYSHHNFTHSVVGGLVGAFLFVLALYLFFRLAYGKGGFKFFAKHYAVYFAAFFLGHLAHLAGDLPTPSSVWDGIRLFWPLETAVGGTGHIWWWNNYDIFLLFFSCCVINIVVIVVAHFSISSIVRYLPAAVFIVCLSLAAYQSANRNHNFAYKKYVRSESLKHEKKSLDIQKKILGDSLYRVMEKIDRAIPIPF